MFNWSAEHKVGGGKRVSKCHVAFTWGAYDGGAYDGGAYDGGAYDGGAYDCIFRALLTGALLSDNPKIAKIHSWNMLKLYKKAPITTQKFVHYKMECATFN